MNSPVIDIHTHMLTTRWLDMLREHGGDYLQVKPNPANGKPCVYKDGAPFMTINPAMSDYDLRVKRMSEAGVDMAVVSLTCPNVYFGGAQVSLAAAQEVNDDMAGAQTQYPERIRWFASLPWQYPDLAVQELNRALAKGAVGVVVLGNIGGKPLTDPLFAPVWKAIDDKALPVFIHPTTPPGIGEMGMNEFALTPQNKATEFSWAMEGPTPYFAKIIHVFIDMDKMVGRDFEAGLASLKSIAEQ